MAKDPLNQVSVPAGGVVAELGLGVSGFGGGAGGRGSAEGGGGRLEVVGDLAELAVLDPDAAAGLAAVEADLGGVTVGVGVHGLAAAGAALGSGAIDEGDALGEDGVFDGVDGLGAGLLEGSHFALIEVDAGAAGTDVEGQPVGLARGEGFGAVGAGASHENLSLSRIGKG